MKTLKQYVRFVLLLTICFSVVWPGGAWAAAGEEMMGPGLKQQAVMRYLAGYLKSQAGSGGKVMTYEYGFKPLSEKTEHGIYSTEIAAGLTDNGALVADAVYRVNDQGHIEKKSSAGSYERFGNATDMYDFDFSGNARQETLSLMKFMPGTHFVQNLQVAINEEEAFWYLSQFIMNRPQYRESLPVDFAIRFDRKEMFNDVAAVWEFSVGENKPEQFVATSHWLVWETGWVQVMDILTGDYNNAEF